MSRPGATILAIILCAGAVVHRAKRHLWPTRSRRLAGRSVRRAARARRVWADSRGRIWVSEWNAGQLGMYDPVAGTWREWPLPGDTPRAYAVYVDEHDAVWLSDFGANALVRFDPTQEEFDVFPLPSPSANIRQILGRPGEVWGAAAGADKLAVVRSP